MADAPSAADLPTLEPATPAFALPVLVVGATGGVGQLVVAQLLAAGYSVRALSRQPDRVGQLFAGRVEAVTGDLRQPESLLPAMNGVIAIIAAAGTTAFPSSRWQVELPPEEALWGWARLLVDADYRLAHSRNSPEAVDGLGVVNLVAAAPSDLQRFVFISSIGVERQQQLPFSLLNAFGVLTAKQQGEQAIQRSGRPYTIFRPGRLIDGPFTSYDLNTLLQAKTNGQRAVVLGQGDRLNGDASRIDVAAACVACLQSSAAENQIFELVSQGDRVGPTDWPALFARPRQI